MLRHIAASVQSQVRLVHLGRRPDACARYHPITVRNLALIALMYSAGLRVSEALALRPKDLDLAEGVLRARHGNGDGARFVGIDAGAAAIAAE